MRSIQRRACRVLFVLGGMDIGGVQSGIMNFVRVVPSDQVKFDVIVYSSKVGFHENEFSEYGNIYHIPLFTSKNKWINSLLLIINQPIFRQRMCRFLKDHPKYDVVHSKSLEYSASAMEAAKRCCVPVRIAQSHVDKPDYLNPFHCWYYSWCAKRIERAATDKLAVSPGAADLMFGKNGGRIIKNPTISLARLDPEKYHPRSHERIRMIQIGTYSRRKNQLFSLAVLERMLDRGVPASLTFIGFPLDEPDYYPQLQAKAKELGLEASVRYLPKDSDVPKELSEADYMLIPSLREGLPNVALEAQAMGVPCFISDTINPETDCGLCVFLPLDIGPEAWANEVLAYRDRHGSKKTFVDMSAWDNVKVCEDYIQIWQRECKRE